MSSGFVSENELAEKRRIRQEEWEKVRQPNQPLEVPEEPYDPRSLYERLEEQRQKKQLEYEEAHKLKNMIKGLDDDEVEFLDLVDQKKFEAEQLKELEEKQELLDFRKKVEELREMSLHQRLQAEILPTKSNSGNSSGVKSQHQLLKGVVVKKRTSDESKTNNKEVRSSDESKANNKEVRSSDESKTNNKEVTTDEIKTNNKELNEENSECSERKKRKNEEDSPISSNNRIPGSGLTCVGILPGLGSYVESSDDSDHSSSESEANDDKKYDLVGRRITYVSKDEQK